MTLFRQLILGVSLLFFVLLAGVEAIYLANARAQLQEQLGAQAQDAATTLALRLATLGNLDDLVLVETCSAPYSTAAISSDIRVLSAAGETLARKTLMPRPGDVPEWFMQAFPIRAPGAQSLVSSGWREIGRVVVVSHPHFAYAAVLDHRPADHRLAAARLCGGRSRRRALSSRCCCGRCARSSARRSPSASAISRPSSRCRARANSRAWWPR